MTRSIPNRRSFLQAAGMATLGLSVASGLTSAEEKRKEENDLFGGFTLGIQSYTFRAFPCEQALKHTQDLGLHCAEFYGGHIPITDDADKINAARKLCKEYDITPVAFGVERFTKNHDENRKKFEFGKALGIKTLSADPDPDSFDSLDKLVDEYKISIGIHPHGPKHRYPNATVILEAVKDHNPLIGTTLDTGHLIKVDGLDPAEEIRKMGPRNFGLHLKDHDSKAGHDVIFGQGRLDVLAILKALRDVKFKGYISIEYEYHEQDPSDDVKACVEVFKEAVKKLN